MFQTFVIYGMESVALTATVAAGSELFYKQNIFWKERKKVKKKNILLFILSIMTKLHMWMNFQGRLHFQASQHLNNSEMVKSEM